MEIKLEGVKVAATLLEEEAPETCEALWNVLPLEAEAKHCAYSGMCIYFKSHKLPIVKPENSSCFVSRGDVVLYPRDPEFLIVYGRRCFLRGPVTDTSPTNVFAVVRDLDAVEKFAEKAADLLNVGAKKIFLRRIE
jgi:hypothetical protein